MAEGETELIIEQIEIGPMQNYTYIVGSKETREVAIVDPAWDISGLLDHLAEREYDLTAVLATHYHPDHVGGHRPEQVAGITCDGQPLVLQLLASLLGQRLGFLGA